MRNVLKRTHLALTFAAVVFMVMIISIMVIFLFTLLLTRLGLLNPMPFNFPLLFALALFCLITGAITAVIISRFPLKPFLDIMDATNKIARGDYSVRLEMKWTEELRMVSSSFNHMAEELGSVEMLRNDFVNNFSHEFKTPIVSIRGFAKMLKWEDLTDSEREEYLDIIIQESERLSQLSTNVLRLSEIEQQTILTDQTLFNVSEQIRLVIAMMDSKWKGRNMEFHFDSPETMLYGNEELLQQVWINLFDNAMKFSPERSAIEISVRKEPGTTVFSVANQSPPLSPETAAHIFDKFYQGDTSHTTQGNGLGLSIVKRIVELHSGTIQVQNSSGNRIVFEIRLPSVQSFSSG